MERWTTKINRSRYGSRHQNKNLKESKEKTKIILWCSVWGEETKQILVSSLPSKSSHPYRHRILQCFCFRPILSATFSVPRPRNVSKLFFFHVAINKIFRRITSLKKCKIDRHSMCSSNSLDGFHQTRIMADEVIVFQSAWNTPLINFCYSYHLLKKATN